MRLLCVFLLLIALFSCSEHADNRSGLTSREGVTASGGSTDGNIVTIGPVNAGVDSVITLQADRSLINSSRIQWYVNDDIFETSRGLRFTSKELNKGDVIHAAVIREDGTYISNRITVINTPPTIRRARIHPPGPVASSTLRVKAEADDPDGDTTGFKYKWYVNGRLTGDHSFLEHEFKRGDKITVEVVPYDEENEGRSVFLESRIFNSLPSITESSPVIEEETYTYRIMADDPDGDTLTYKLEEGPDGMTVDQSGVITWKMPQKTGAEFDVKVSVSDNNGGKIQLSFTAEAGFRENPSPE